MQIFIRTTMNLLLILFLVITVFLWHDSFIAVVTPFVTTTNCLMKTPYIHTIWKNQHEIRQNPLFQFEMQHVQANRNEDLSHLSSMSSSPNKTVNTTTKATSFRLDISNNTRRIRRNGFFKSLKKYILFWRKKTDDDNFNTSINFVYDYDLVEIDGRNIKKNKDTKTIGIVLIHPIGVGIAKWYYERLIQSLIQLTSTQQRYQQQQFIVVVPDLLGSGTAASNVTTITSFVDENGDYQEKMTSTGKIPLLNISNWSDQIYDLMTKVEHDYMIDNTKNVFDCWCIVANGGCSPIALQVAEKSIKNEMIVTTTTHQLIPNVTNIILSSVPRLSFFLPSMEQKTNPQKVQRSYNILCGLPGNLFWWYACHNNGSFIQKFSEKNLVANSSNLGPSWTRNCYNTATMNIGKSKYSTFAFLAGTLQDGCQSSLDILKGTNVEIDIIKGKDIRQNGAKSWFWQRRTKKRNNNDSKKNIQITKNQMKAYETLQDYVQRSGNGGKIAWTGGRISLAHEDPDAYAEAVMNFLF